MPGMGRFQTTRGGRSGAAVAAEGEAAQVIPRLRAQGRVDLSMGHLREPEERRLVRLQLAVFGGVGHRGACRVQLLPAVAVLVAEAEDVLSHLRGLERSL